MYFAAKFSIENLENLTGLIKLDNKMFLQINLLKKTFLNELNLMVSKKLEQISYKHQKKVLKIKNKKNISTSITILSPIKDICRNFRLKGFFHLKVNKACGNIFFFSYSDAEIIEIYSIIMYGLLFYYQAADNFIKIKNILFHLRKSCVLTLARKHNKNKI